MSLPRILLFTAYYHPIIGGVETHARRLAASLTASGVPLWVLTKRTSDDLPEEDIIEGVRVRRIRPSGARAAGAKWHLVPWAFSALMAARDDFDVILCVDYRAIGVAAMAAGRLLGRPVVLEAETPGALSCANWDPALTRLGLAPDGRLGTAFKWPVRAIYGSAEGYACISREFLREAEAYGSPASLKRYLPHTVDMDAFHPPSPDEQRRARHALSLPEDRKIVAFVGRLAREKGILDLLEAWRRLDRSDAVLFVVGPEMPGNALDVGPQVREAAATFAPGRVILHGPATDVRPMLAAADVFVQPSHYEAFGLSVIEAMASGCAVVATRVGGMAEYLRHDGNALLCDPHDPAALADRIATVLDEPQLLLRLRGAARATAEAEFDDRVVTRDWVAFLQAVHDQKTGRQVKNSAAIKP